MSQEIEQAVQGLLGEIAPDVSYRPDPSESTFRISFARSSQADAEMILSQASIPYTVSTAPGARGTIVFFDTEDDYKRAQAQLSQFGYLFRGTESRVEKGVQELVREIPYGYEGSDFSKQDVELILLALEKGIIPDKLPSPNDMVHALSELPGSQTVSVQDIDFSSQEFMGKAEIASAWIANVLAPTLRTALDSETEKPDLESLEEAREPLQPGVTRTVVKAARDWIATKRRISDLKTQLAKLSGKSGALEKQLLPVVRELDEQKMRIDNVIVALQKRKGVKYKAWLEKALEVLDQINKRFARKVRRFEKEVTDYSEHLKLEATAVRAFNWLRSFAKRAWSWLRGTEREITELEEIVFYRE